MEIGYLIYSEFFIVSQFVKLSRGFLTILELNVLAAPPGLQVIKQTEESVN